MEAAARVPELSKKLFMLIKTENQIIRSYENASRERISIASQLSEWGESTGDDGLSDISDKLGVLLSEIGEQENTFAEGLEDSRTILKQIRNTESSVQPSRDHKSKVADEIQKLKYKDPQSAKIAQLEQELIRTEAENLVAEAQLTNVTRQKIKQAYDLNFAATIERAERQIILANHGRRMLNLLDDSPVVPGDARPAFEHSNVARQIINDAEDDLRAYRPQYEPVQSSAEGLQSNTLMPAPTESSVAGGQEVPSSVAGDENTLSEQRQISGSVNSDTADYAPSQTASSTAA
ncbi:MAG: hypothetical protein M1825_001642 [Sarcosagium campestre]|nr:MAG: hypothetical protein M1825_001642 [Sarcosagium campestre]